MKNTLLSLLYATLFIIALHFFLDWSWLFSITMVSSLLLYLLIAIKLQDWNKNSKITKTVRLAGYSVLLILGIVFIAWVITYSIEKNNQYKRAENCINNPEIYSDDFCSPN